MRYLPGLLTIAIVAGSRLFAQAGHPRTSAPGTRSYNRTPTCRRTVARVRVHFTGGPVRDRPAEQLTINLAVRCFGPNGKGLFQADSYPIGDAEDAELIADVSGIYRLRLIASEPHAPDGLYRITLRKIGRGDGTAYGTSRRRPGIRAGHGLLPAGHPESDARSHRPLRRCAGTLARGRRSCRGGENPVHHWIDVHRNRRSGRSAQAYDPVSCGS